MKTTALDTCFVARLRRDSRKTASMFGKDSRMQILSERKMAGMVGTDQDCGDARGEKASAMPTMLVITLTGIQL